VGGRLGFGTGPQKMVLGRWTTPTISRRTGTALGTGYVRGEGNVRAQPSGRATFVERGNGGGELISLPDRPIRNFHIAVPSRPPACAPLSPPAVHGCVRGALVGNNQRWARTACTCITEVPVNLVSPPSHLASPEGADRLCVSSKSPELVYLLNQGGHAAVRSFRPGYLVSIGAVAALPRSLGGQKADVHTSTPGPSPREGRCLGWLGVSCPHAPPVPHPWGAEEAAPLVTTPAVLSPSRLSLEHEQMRVRKKPVFILLPVQHQQRMLTPVHLHSARDGEGGGARYSGRNTVRETVRASTCTAHAVCPARADGASPVTGGACQLHVRVSSTCTSLNRRKGCVSHPPNNTTYLHTRAMHKSCES
jgi:hypothetical protein